MLPFLHFGSLTVNTYALMYALMYWIIGCYGFARVSRLPHPPQVLGRAMILVICGLFLGSIAPGLVQTLAEWVATGRFVWHRSIRVIGGLLVTLPLAWIYLRRHGIPIGRAFDLGGLPVPLGLAVGRLGCLAAGCCGGATSNSCVALKMPDLDGVWAVRYPTQIGSMAADLAIYAVLLGWEKYGAGKTRQEKTYPFDGFLFLLFLELYFVKRFLVQFLRADNIPIWGALSLMHLFFLAGIAAVSLAVAVCWRRAAAGTSPAVR